MKAIEKFRQDLKSGKICIGASISFTDHLVTDALGDSVDFFWIDLEHSAMSIEALGGHLLAARSRNVPALVRVSGSSTPFIKMVLDAGAEGIIVPQIKTVEEVMAVVNDCRYPPLGKRGYGPRVPSNYGRNGGSEYINWANENIFVSVQIETMEAFEALDDILEVSGLDSIVIGPWDLSAAFGMLGNVENSEVVRAIETIISKTRAAGLFIGAGMGPDPDYACTMAKRGVQWLQVGGDFGYLIKTADDIVSTIQTRLGGKMEKRGKT
ncbi:MAG: aldolase/citrate lyase family protein [Clostridiales bacterium]|nr:aldolase/citrate lyase family protein [Clostridiales bacterium]